VAGLEERERAGKPTKECSMTLYRLYLRSRIRRELLAPDQSGCETEPFAPPPVGQLEHPSMVFGDHRYSYVITGREEFEAENDAAALAVARSIRDAASDLCDAFELWDAGRQIDQSRMATLQTSVVTAQWQDHVIQAEEALLKSGWAIARSRRLLARFDELRKQPPSGESVSPATTAQ
jgi:hypothetical protein